MGTYNSAVITNGGQSMIAQSVAGASLEFTTIKTSDYTYPAGTNLAALTTINSIKQTKDITGATVYNSRVIKVSAAVDNTGLSTAYAINTIGIYAKVGSAAETLFAVVTASAADTMPAYSNKPYSYIYEVNLTMQNAANVTVTVNSAGLVNVSDLNAAKVEIRGEIDDLKSALNDINDILDVKVNKTATGNEPASRDAITLMSGLRIQNGHTYTYAISIATALEVPIYVYLKNSEGQNVNTMTVNAGETTKSKTFTADSDISASLVLINSNQAVSYTLTIADSETDNKIDELQELVATFSQDITDLNEIVGRQVPISISGVADALTTLQYIYSPLTIINGHSYTYTITVDTASDQPVYVHIKAQQGESSSLSSLTLNAGETTKSKTFTATSDTDVGAIAISTVNRQVKYTIVFTDNNAPEDYVTTLRQDVDALKLFTGYTDGLAFTEKAYIETPSVGGTVDTTPTTLNGCACASVACQKGDIFTIYGTPRANSGTRPYMWVNANGRCVYRSEQTEAFNGEEIVAPYDGTLVVNFLMSSDYAVYKGVRNLHGHIIENINDIKSIVNSPLETLPEYITNDLAYKPLGQLQHPYLCLSCDDGSAELETYTIPMLLNKNVPCTFGLWATHSEYGESPVFSPSVILRTQSGIDAVLSAILNGCEVAQHGTVEWTEMTEAELNDFFDREQVAFANMGITVKGAICPSHCVNNKVRAIAGGRFGSVRSGYNGFKSKADQQNHIAGDVFAPYGFLTGARSNCYSYTSFNTIDKTLTELKAILDNAIANNMCMIVYWHDWDLTASQKADLEAFIDYAKTTAVNFCTLSEIPTLV